MIVRLVLSFVLALAPAAQAQVVTGRMPTAPVGGIGLAPLGTPQIAAPSLDDLRATPLASSLAAPAFMPTPSALMVERLEAVPIPRALAVSRPAAIVPEGLPERRSELQRRVALRRFAELKAYFGDKKPEEVEATAVEPAAPLAHNEFHAGHTPRPEPPQGPKPGKTGFTRPLAFFLISMIVAQIGIEAQTAGLPPLIAKVFGNVSVAADVGIAAALAELVGTLASPIVAKHLGLKSAYLWSTGLRVATGGLIAGMLAANWLSVGGLVALMAVDALLLGVSLTTEKSIPAVMVNQDQGKLEHFKAARQTAIEAVATVVPIVTGIAVAALGFIPALIAFPVALTISITTVALTLKLPGRISGLSGDGLPGPGEGSLKTYIEHLSKGVKEVLTTPTLRLSVLAYSLVYAPIILVYWVMAPAYALHLAGPGHEALATAYSGMMTGLYSLGGIVAGVWTMRQQRKARGEAAMRRSMIGWTTACALGMALLGVMAIPAAPIWGTVTLPALALFLFGVPQVMARLKLESYYQSRAPAGSIADATAVLESASSIAIIGGLWVFGKLLAGAGIVSLTHLALAVGPMIAALLLLTWALARASKPRP